ncbi:hypothetical protein [Streptomyces sp. NPDC058612]|uniref:hypothetical protein n=1 Tax=Streptomyces sp. NPDC058612 TaxID=3346555 RepID=UPI0036463F87
MNKSLLRASTVCLALTVFTGIVTVSQSASAAQTCTANGKIHSMFGTVPEAQLNSSVCAEALADNKIRGKATVGWEFINDGQSDMTSKRFNSFKITTRLERREPGAAEATDVVVTSKTCDFTADINKQAVSAPSVFACLTPAVTLDGTKEWSGDATVVYDVAGDTKGSITWQLNGSPLMS